MKGKQYQYILFDLDGTLTDPKEGITKCVQHALSHFGIDEPDLDQLEKFIGPPLRVSFEEFYGFDEQTKAEAIKVFRERYNTDGVYENEIYPGMAEFLKECKEENKILAIASSKPQVLVHQVLSNFGIEKYFEVIVGSVADGERDTKIEVIEEALRQLFPMESENGEKEKDSGADERGADNRSMKEAAIPRDKILMVGDRVFDVEGAAHFGIDCVGVTYGYAKEEELRNAKADYLAENINELREIVLGRWAKKEMAEKLKARKAADVLSPLIIYWFIGEMAFVAAAFLVALIAESIGDAGKAFVEQYNSQISVYINGLANLVTLPYLYKEYKKVRVKDISPVVKRRYDSCVKKWWPCVAAVTIVLAVGLNYMLSQFSFVQNSQSYQQAAKMQYSVSLVEGLIIFGFVIPFVEEMIFRGVLYNKLKEYFVPVWSVFLSAMIFGMYHGNIVQLVYAFLMGSVMAYVYEKTKRFSMPVMMHCLANIVVYIMSSNAG